MVDPLSMTALGGIAAGALIKDLMARFIEPVISQVAKEHRTNKNLIQHSFVNKFELYMERSFQKNSYISTVVFQNEKKNLLDIYVPLVIGRDQLGNGEDGVLYKLDSLSAEFVSNNSRSMIIDRAGMGKSTVLKYIFLSIISSNAGIPILVELRNLKAGVQVVDFLVHELSGLSEKVDKDFLIKLIERGEFVFLFDGYDEIASDEREAVVRELANFIDRSGKNKFVITSRPETSLSSFSGFQAFSIQPLSEEDAFLLLRKYDMYGSISEGLIGKLRSTEMRAVREYLRNPLLTSLLYKAYEFKSVVPYKKHLFYRQVYDALFDRHDLKKEEGGFVRRKLCGLDTDDFHRVIRYFAFLSIKAGKVQYTKDEFLMILRSVKDLCKEISFKESAVILDCTSSVPLFVEEGNEYRWSHKSLQDYFAASFIWLDSKKEQESILKALAYSAVAQKYDNILDIYYDMDQQGFRLSIIFEFAKNYAEYCRSSYGDMRNSGFSEEKISERQEYSFLYNLAIISKDGKSKALKRVVRSNGQEDRIVDSVFLSKAFRGVGLDGDWRGGMYFYYFDDSMIAVAPTKHTQIASLLSRKQNPAVAQSTFYSGEHTIKAENNLPDFGDIVAVSDNIQSPINSALAFEAVNRILSKCCPMRINKDQCDRMHHDILKEMEGARTGGSLAANL